MARCVLGIDTSAYTTSVSILDVDGNLLADERIILQVPSGQQGLRQSDAVFQHVRNLPQAVERAFRQASHDIALVAVTTQPRPLAESYMPVFRAGEGTSRSIAAALGVPLHTLSHQEGHIWAGVWSAGGPQHNAFLALHLSGGTTEVLHVDRQANASLNLVVVGGTSDLHAGQFVDRVGVALGLPFPAGPHLERLAREARHDAGDRVDPLPVAVTGNQISFSGPAAAAERRIAAGAPPAQVARAVEDCLADSCTRILLHILAQHRIPSFLGVGGVFANQAIRNKVQVCLADQGTEVFFAAPSYSVDNAVGPAVAGVQRLAAGRA